MRSPMHPFALYAALRGRLRALFRDTVSQEVTKAVEHFGVVSQVVETLAQPDPPGLEVAPRKAQPRDGYSVF